MSDIEYFDQTEVSCMSEEFINKEAVDNTLTRLIDMTNQTCLVALDKSLMVIKTAVKSNSNYTVAFARTNSISKRMVMACVEVGLTLPPEQRVG